MPYQNNIITKSVTISDIQKALRTSVSTIGDLCRHKNINIFAVWKPFSIGESADGLNFNTSILRAAGFGRRRYNGFGLKAKMYQCSLDALVSTLSVEIRNNTELYRNGFVEWVDKANLQWARKGDFVDNEDDTKGYFSTAQMAETIGTAGNAVTYKGNVSASYDFSVETQDSGTENQNWNALDNIHDRDVNRLSVNVFDVIRNSILQPGTPFNALNGYTRVIIVFGNGFIGYTSAGNDSVIPWKDWEQGMSDVVTNPAIYNAYYFAECLMTNDDFRKIADTPDPAHGKPAPHFYILPNLVGTVNVRFKYGVTILGYKRPWGGYELIQVALAGRKFYDTSASPSKLYFKIEYLLYNPSMFMYDLILQRTYRDYTDAQLNTSTLIGDKLLPDWEDNDGMEAQGYEFCVRFTSYRDENMSSVIRSVTKNLTKDKYM